MASRARSGLFDGRYRLVRPIGSGGMATVWLAEDESLGRHVAIKVLAERFAEDHQFVERFRREARAAASLNHPNIVAVYDRGEAVQDGRREMYIAMEYLDGRSLKDVILEEAPLEPMRAVDYALQILAALRFAHRHGVVHRDIKPHNIIVGRDGRLKVTDFGIARAGTERQMTEVGSIIGTAQYLSPEQARGHDVGPASDLYSLGVVLFEMLTGRVPFEGDSAVSIAMKHVSDPPPRPSRLRPGIPERLEQVVLRALAKDTSIRYRSADEMAVDLDRVRRGASPTAETRQLTQILAGETQATRVVERRPDATRVWAPPPMQEPGRMGPAPPPPPVRRRRPVWPWVLVLLLLAAAGAVTAFALGVFDTSTHTTTRTKPTLPRVVRVPAGLIGLGQDEAVVRVRRAGLVPRTQEVRSGATVGTVVETVPPAGARENRGDSVLLKISKGLPQVQVPDVTGHTLHAATSQLEGAHLKVSSSSAPNDAPKGQVVSQQPQGGSLATEGSTVMLVVSQGPPQVQVPDVTSDSQDGAVKALKQAGFVIGSISRISSDAIPAGQVISTKPNAGAEADKGSSVDVLVSSGPHKVEVPDVTGLDEATATSKLQGVGLNVQPSTIPVTDPSDDGVVVRQSPVGGNRVLPDARVIIRVGQLQGSTGTTPTGTTPTGTTPTGTTATDTTSTDTTATDTGTPSP